MGRIHIHILTPTTNTTTMKTAALTLLLLFGIISTMEARSPLTKLAKMNKVAKMAQVKNQETVVEKVGCDVEHYCPNGCCSHETDMGNDGDWVCCGNYPVICAEDPDSC